MLDLSMVVPPGHAREAAAQMRAKMSDAMWLEMLDLACAVVALQESEAAGQTILVAPIHRESLQAVARRLP